jgi:CelD/BcsL family acetyltransferase involved in cellulose biosynthesis
LDSPYFHPAFARKVAESGPPVSVLVAYDEDGDVASLLPFQWGRRGVMRPVGWPGADFQGPLTRPGTRLAESAVLAPGARAFRFDHLVEIGGELDRWVLGRRPSPYVDVTGGLAGYLGRASRSGRENLGQARRRLARAERELGPVRFSADVIDDALLDRVVELKRRQYAATGARDYFAGAGRVRLMHRLMRTHEDGFAGVLSAVHAGDELLAAHFGLRSGPVLHWWFPVYDPRHARLAPGWILLRELIAAAPALGLARIDLGRGEDEYKRRVKTGETTVAQGLVASPARVVAERVRRQSVQALKRSRVAGRAKILLRRSG